MKCPRCLSPNKTELDFGVKRDGSKMKMCNTCRKNRRLSYLKHRVLKPKMPRTPKKEYSKEEAQIRHRLFTFGVTEEEYKERTEKQGGVCAICGEMNRNGGALSIDHDHQTGHNRGLLCNRCNPGLGYFRDNPDLLRKAAEYLDGFRPKGLLDAGRKRLLG